MDQVKLSGLVELVNNPVVDDSILKIHRPYHQPDEEEEDGIVYSEEGDGDVDPIYDDA